MRRLRARHGGVDWRRPEQSGSKRVLHSPTTACTSPGWQLLGAEQEHARLANGRAARQGGATRRSIVRRSRTRARTAFAVLAEGARGRQRACGVRRRPGQHHPWWLRRVAGGHHGQAARPASRRSTALRRAVWHHMRRSRGAGDRPDRHPGQASERATVAERPGPLVRVLRERPLSTHALTAWLAGRADRYADRQHSDRRKHRQRRRSRVHGPRICPVRRAAAGAKVQGCCNLLRLSSAQFAE